MKNLRFYFVLACCGPLLLGLTTLMQAQTNCVPAPSGLVSWWSGDGNANDIVNGNDGTLVNGTTFATGKVGQAFSLDGVNDFVNIPDALNLRFSPNAPMTIELWAFRTSTAVQHILGKRLDCGASNFDYQMAYSGTLGFGSLSGSVGTGSGLLPLSTWTHLAATFDGSTFRFYVNGVLQGTGTGTMGPITTGPFRLGTSGTCHLFNTGFGGLIDEVAIYNRALSASEIQAIVNAGSAGKCKDIPIITNQTLPEGVVGESYSETLTAVLGTPPYSFSLISGAIPPGLNLSSGGAISGTPTIDGAFTFTVEVTDSQGKASQKQLSINVLACVQPPSGLVSWWSGDGNANDIVNGNDGTLTNGATFAPGKVGQAFSLDGVNDFVLVSDAPELRLTGSYTIDFWFNLATPHGPGGSFKRPINKEAFPNGYSGLFNSDGTLYFGSVNGSGVQTSTSSWPASVWHHVAFTFDGTHTKAYVNGILENSVLGGTITSTTAPFRIGISSVSHQAFPGLIDEVAIYNRALSAAEIQAIFSAGSAGKCKGPLNQAPTAICKDMTLTLDASGQATLVPSDVDAGSSDPDGDPITFSLDKTSFTCADLGPNTVTLTVTDDSDEFSTCTATVTVVDDTPPVVTADLILRELKENSEGDRGRGDFEVACAASDNCSVTVSGLMQIPPGFDDSRVEIAFEFKPGAASAINFHENKNGKLSIELEGADEVALSAQLNDILAAGGVAVSNGQLLDLRFRVRQNKGQKFDFDFLNGVLVQEKVEGEDPQTITMFCNATDGSDNSASTSAIADFSQIVMPKLGTPEKIPTAGIPGGFSLEQNHPNPFNPSTTITFSVPEAGEVTLAIYNLRGQLIQTLHSGAILAGQHSVVWNGTDFRGAKVASGIYLYKLAVKDFVATKRLVLMK